VWHVNAVATPSQCRLAEHGFEEIESKVLSKEDEEERCVCMVNDKLLPLQELFSNFLRYIEGDIFTLYTLKI